MANLRSVVSTGTVSVRKSPSLRLPDPALTPEQISDAINRFVNWATETFNAAGHANCVMSVEAKRNWAFLVVTNTSKPGLGGVCGFAAIRLTADKDGKFVPGLVYKSATPTAAQQDPNKDYLGARGTVFGDENYYASFCDANGVIGARG